MKIEYIREFIALAELNNYTLAAQKLFITQSALSRHIAALEESIGTRLVQRSTHDVKLTENGLKANEAFKKIIEAYDSLCVEINDSNNGMAGFIRLGMLNYSIRRDYGILLPLYKEAYPNVKIECFPCQPHVMYQLILNGKIDIGVVFVADYLDQEQIALHKVFRDNTSAMLSYKHPLAEKASLRMADLADEKIILLKEDTCYNTMATEAMNRCRFIPKEIVLSDFLDTVPFTIQTTNGVHINSSSLTLPSYSDIIRTIPIEDKLMKMTHAFAYRKDNTNPIIPYFMKMADGLDAF